MDTRATLDREREARNRMRLKSAENKWEPIEEPIEEPFDRKRT